MPSDAAQAGEAYIAANFESLVEARVEKALNVYHAEMLEWVLNSVIPMVVKRGVESTKKRLAEIGNEKAITESRQIENVAKSFQRGKTGPIIRFLSRFMRYGVTYDEYLSHRDHHTKERLTEMVDPVAIAADLRRRSGKLKAHGYRITATKERIKLEKA